MPAVLALVAAFCWGLGDFLLGVQARRSPVLAVALVGQASGFVILAGIVLARGIPAPPLEETAVALVAGVIGAGVFCLIIAALAMGNMARVAPILGMSAVVPVVVGLARGESPAPIQLAGIIVATLGVVLVSTERIVEEHHGLGRTSTAMLMAAAAAVGIGLVLVGIDHSSDYDPYWATLLFRVAGVVILGAITIAVIVSGRVAPGPVIAQLSFLPLIAFGVLDTAANAVWAVASTGDLLSVVAVLGSIFPVVTVLLAVIVVKEPLDRLQAAGVAVTVAGTAMITAG